MKDKKLLIFNIILACIIFCLNLPYVILNNYHYIFKGILCFLILLQTVVNIVCCLKNYKIIKKSYITYIVLATLFILTADLMIKDMFNLSIVFVLLSNMFLMFALLKIQKLSLKDLITFVVFLTISLCCFLLPKNLDYDGTLYLVILYSIISSFAIAKSLNILIINKKYTNLHLLFVFLGVFMLFFANLVNFISHFMFGNLVLNLLYLSTFYISIVFISSSIWYISCLKQKEFESLSLFKKFCYRLYQKSLRLVMPFLPYRDPIVLNNYKLLANKLKDKKITKAIIITGPKILKLGLISDMKHALDDEKIEYEIFDETVENTTIKSIEDATKLYLKNNCQAIIAIGGGSVIDCAKMVGARVVNPNKTVEQMKGLLKVGKRLPTIIAIPTTAGTGSETTLSAVVTNEKTHQKFAINDFCLIPHYVVLDCGVTLKLPKQLTVATGMDALTHAIEAYIGHSTTRYTRKMSEYAVKLILDNLYRCYQNPDDFEARKNMLKASFYAGKAFSRSYVGYVHAIAHSLGGKYNMSHGLLNAVILPKMLRCYEKSCYKKLAKLARFCMIAEKKDSNIKACEKFIYFIEQMNLSMNVPKYIDTIKDEDIEELSKLAEKEANPLYPVPKIFSSFELTFVYRYIKGDNVKKENNKNEDLKKNDAKATKN